ncbi:ShlB/FhaC/HecB family hemolysin secretion/activation protein [Echinimonas agarilytica]|uniref:BamA/TamA family outer membrane protein n=1 Tax=Echinimonas agarilytica TaxID=1215918 RepID=A0AA42B7R9_9GAMM|nr:ShlB/FhaC/HecB family hemolysin secretion/activation protein [Echinimonas agarilytica]MCM2679613.1 BamA/TamA family outer membrane protein [Echinimonas agarilytica]
MLKLKGTQTVPQSSVIKRLGAVALLQWGVCSAAIAQELPALQLPNDPAATQQRQQQNRERLEQQKKLKERAELVDPIEGDITIDSPTVPTNDSVRFELKAIKFTPSEWLTEHQLSEVAAQFTGKSVGFSDVKALLDAVNQLYRDKNILTASAILPPQKIADGILNIKLVEGRVGKIDVQGNASTSEKYVADRVQLKQGELVDLSSLEHDLVRLNRTSDIQVRAQMAKGDSFGETDLILQAFEPPHHIIDVYGDNTGTDETGENRFGIGYTNNSVFGVRDRLNMNFTGASGSQSFMFYYDVPVTRSGGKIGITYLDDELDIDNPSLGDVDVDSESTAKIIRFVQPVWINDLDLVNVTFDFEDRKSKTTIDGFLVQRSDVDTWPIGINWNRYTEQGAVFAGFKAIRGREQEFDARYFTRYTAYGSYVHQWNEKWSASLNVSGQFADDNNLPGGQAFQIGGAATVRGYEEGLVSGDEGFLLNFELQHSIPQPRLAASLNTPVTFTAFAFMDRGGAYRYRPEGPSHRKGDQLGSVGVGFNLSASRVFQATFTLGFPVLENVHDQDNGRAHFNISYTPLIL